MFRVVSNQDCQFLMDTYISGLSVESYMNLLKLIFQVMDFLQSREWGLMLLDGMYMVHI